ncbi:adenine nucleotide alpha hydrolases-like protein [Amniculicola lignicola CBS 123094]|uniref:Adenine nucleotide alpha hydrolases-like protein n=1 Tax=Amniculicola lignicola CBS 123094 TaxID=1392246 RepID=A0A6A5X0D4_9PLEO|nr:adenine nucleotide alpha hydrolases-like protein [Amniculicola lignicola CBS 123094]
MSVSPTSEATEPARVRIASPPQVPSTGVASPPPQRRASLIQFGLPKVQGSPKQSREKRRLSSPPPPPAFKNRISFDTFDRPADFIEDNAFTLIAKHKDYEYSKRSRTFLCGCDEKEYSDYALQWLLDELVDDGDEIVCLKVVEKDESVASDRAIEKGRYRAEAEELMKKIQTKNHENKAISLVLEFAVGKVNNVIDDMINLYEPAILIVGTRGRSLGGFQGLLPGSVSKYCLQHSPVPVIVVRPSSKRDKARSKRAQDPNRQGYKDILDKSGPQGGHILDLNNLSNFIVEEDEGGVTDDEAAAVAAAVGYKPQPEASSLSQVEATPDAGTGARENSLSPDLLRSPGVVMKSPDLRNLDSPEISDISSSDSEDQGGVPTTADPATAHEPIEFTSVGTTLVGEDGVATGPAAKEEPEVKELETKLEDLKTSEAS